MSGHMQYNAKQPLQVESLKVFGVIFPTCICAFAWRKSNECISKLFVERFMGNSNAVSDLMVKVQCPTSTHQTRPDFIIICWKEDKSEHQQQIYQCDRWITLTISKTNGVVGRVCQFLFPQKHNKAILIGILWMVVFVTPSCVCLHTREEVG